MKSKWIIILFFWISNIYSQNIIVDGSFEDDIPVDINNWTPTIFYNLYNWRDLYFTGKNIYINKNRSVNFYYDHIDKIYLNINAYKGNGYILGHRGRYKDILFLDSNYNPPLLINKTMINSPYIYDDWGLRQEMQIALQKDSWYRVSYRLKLGDSRPMDTFIDRGQWLDSVRYHNVNSGFDVFFSTDDSYCNVNTFTIERGRSAHLLADSFPTSLHDSVFDMSYQWRLVEHTFKADSNYKHIYIGQLRHFFRSRYYIEPGFVPTKDNLEFFYFIDDVRLLPISEYIKTTNDTTVCSGDTIVFRILAGKGPYTWINIKNPSVIVSTDSFIKVVAKDSNERFVIASPYDTASVNLYVAAETQSQDTFNYLSCKNEPLTLNIPILYKWYDNTEVKTKTFNQTGSYWYKTKKQCHFNLTKLNVVISKSKNDTIYKTACDEYTYNNVKYTESTKYSDKYTTATGCDSIITLNLTIYKSTLDTLIANTCSSYKWGDSIYTKSGFYSKKYTSSQGCDSVITLNLTIGLNPKVTLSNGINYTAQQDSVSYQWYRCNPWRKISNETSQTFTTKTKGNYAVVLHSKDGCTDTSDCIALYSASMLPTNISDIIIYPNPTDNILNIDLSSVQEFVKISIYDLTGREVMYNDFKNSSSMEISMASLEKGLYYIKVTTKNHVEYYKVEKK